MFCINKYIQFEVETRMMPFSVLGGVVAENEQDNSGDGEYKIATEDDIIELARILGGG